MDQTQFWTTAIVFTLLGIYFGLQHNKKFITAATIDELIKTGYLKTKGIGRDLEILKHDES